MNCRPAVLLALLAAAGALAAPAAVSSRAGRFTVEMTTDPSPPAAGQNLFTFAIADGHKPLSGATVDVHIDMVGMPMPADAKATAGRQAGQYVATVTLGMAGEWRVTARVQQMAGMPMAGDGAAEFLVETGKGVTAATGRRWWPAALAALLAIALTVLAMRLRKGLPRAARGAVVGVLTLAVVLAATIIVVRRYRDPKTATVLGSATMNMSAMQAPVGTVPVLVETVRREPFVDEISYPATVVPDAEEDVYPRVTGRLVYMPYYPGDVVRRGELVARLDTEELAAKEAQARYGSAEAARGVSAASAGVDTARAQRDKAATMVSQARAQVAGAQSASRAAQGAVKAAEAELAAARQRATEAESAVASAQSAVNQADEGVQQAQAEVDSTQADATYWSAELPRERELYRLGAISKEELDRETAQGAVAAARLKQAAAGLRAMQAGAQRARQDVTQAEARSGAAQAAISAAEARVEQARGERQASEDRVAETRAGVRTAEAEVRAAGAEVSGKAAQVEVSRASVSRARAAVTEAATVRGYTEIRAASGGVITARLVSPGVLVQPGTAIVTIAVVGTVRVQANVAQEDLAGLQVGQPVVVHPPDRPDELIRGQVTSVFPASDPTSRTSVVEARVRNVDGALKLGQYVEMRLDRGETAQTAISVSNRALLSRDGETTVFAVVSGAGGDIARRVAVKTGKMSNERTTILSGLKEGSRVVTVGNGDLRDGDAVSVRPKPTTDTTAAER